MKNAEKKNLLGKLADRLRDPLQFRVVVAVVTLAIGYLAVFAPLSDQIATQSQELKKAEEHQALTKEIDLLESQVKRVKPRLPKNADTNEWVQYVFGGVRNLPVRLLELDSEDLRRVGPFEAVVLRVGLQGDYAALESFVAWVETNERLFRIDSVTIQPRAGATNSK